MTRDKLALESAVADTVLMARLAVEFLGQGLGLDEKTETTLVAGEIALAMFVVQEVVSKAHHLEKLYYGAIEA